MAKLMMIVFVIALVAVQGFAVKDVPNVKGLGDEKNVVSYGGVGGYSGLGAGGLPFGGVGGAAGIGGDLGGGLGGGLGNGIGGFAGFPGVGGGAGPIGGGVVGGVVPGIGGSTGGGFPTTP